MNIRLKSGDTPDGATVEWENGEPFPLLVSSISIQMNAGQTATAFVRCYSPSFDVVADADIRVFDPKTGKVYALVEVDG